MDPTGTYVVCRKCGHEREVSRDDLLKGAWKRKPCPVCESTHSDAPDDDEREPVPAA